MALRITRPAAAMMSAAALSLLATPATAASLPLPAGAKAYDPSIETVERHRRHRDRDGIDAGDVIAGVLILGGIAAIAGAAKNRDREEYRYPPPPAPDSQPRYRGVATTDRYEGGLGRAVDLCVGEVERGFGDVGEVDGANRTGEGWQVSGQLSSGRAWSCWIGNDGRVSGVDLGDGYERSGGYEDSSAAQPADGQWSDEAYARARARTGGPGEYGG